MNSATHPMGSNLNLPNAITLLRLLAVPGVAWLLETGRHGPAFWLFLAAALSDGIDGFLARRFGWITPLGALLDTLTDKALGITTLLLLTWQALIPWWVTLAIVLRDAVVVLGALAYRSLAGHLEVQPTWLGKVNTFLEFSLLCVVLAQAGLLLPLAEVARALFVTVFITTVGSGLHYVLVWGRRYRDERAGGHTA